MVQLRSGENSFEILLHDHDDEFIEEGCVVSGLGAVPDGEEQQGQDLADVAVSQKLETLVHVVGSEAVRVAVETVYVVLELGGALETERLDVVAGVPGRR